jgi:Spy/CpxP family protein refolding chaperone
MLGFVLGGLCAIAAFKVGRRIRRRRWHGGWGAGGYGRGYRSRAGWMLGSLFESLRTTPDQEHAILAALDELRSNRELVGGEIQQTRGELAQALRSGVVDDAAFEEAFARHDRLLARLRISFVEALKRASEALDGRQREALAERLEARAWFGRRPRVWV